jgi:hypothetical protein
LPADRLDPEGITMLVDERPTRLESAVELRLGEKRAGQLENLVGFA